MSLMKFNNLGVDTEKVRAYFNSDTIWRLKETNDADTNPCLLYLYLRGTSSNSQF